jgi:hypothetical protein
MAALPQKKKLSIPTELGAGWFRMVQSCSGCFEEAVVTIPTAVQFPFAGYDSVDQILKPTVAAQMWSFPSVMNSVNNEANLVV